MSLDGTDKLCLALYGHPARPDEYVGGSHAKMLHDAAARLATYQARQEELEEALALYGQHEPGCRYGEQRPDAECTCGLEAVVNGSSR